MSISSQYTQERQRAQERSTAIKILGLMEPLRMSNSPNKARRWVWELLQNAKDVCNEKVRIKIDFNESEKILRFYHNGKPFNVQSIAFLIEQVSTKERDSSKTETTGKFGTGFVTTHLLSEIVDVDSVIEDNEKLLRKFSITLDRSGRTIDNILSSIEKSAEQLKKVDSNDILENYNANEFNTCFTYRLNDAGVQVAKQGLKDLSICLPYTMIFLDKIESVYLSHCDTLYTIAKDANKEQASIYNFFIKTNISCEATSYLLSQNVKVKIALPLNQEKNGLIRIDKNCPRLFCDFPLIGTEDFVFPCIVQSKYFNPNDPRDAIYLSDSDEPSAIQNVELIGQAKELFFILCDYLSKSNFEKLCYLFDINRKYKNENVDPYWLDTELIERLEAKLLCTDLVKTENNEFGSILDGGFNPSIYFPYNAKKENRTGLWNLYARINRRELPCAEDYEEWYEFVWKDCPKLDINKLCIFLKENQSMADLLVAFQTQEEGKVIDWLNQFIKVVQNDQVAWTGIKEDEWTILMNQNGQLSLLSKLSEDRIENEVLKQVVDECGYNIKNELIDKRMMLNEYCLKCEISDEILINTISKKLNSTDFLGKLSVSEKIITLYSNSNEKKTLSLFNFYERLYGELGDRQKVELDDEKLWHEAERLLINKIVEDITQAGEVALMDVYGFSNDNDVILWIAELVDFLEKNYDTVYRKTIKILPNQNGIFCTKELIKLDDGDIDEELKNISALLGDDCRAELLDTKIFLKMAENLVVHEIDVVESIKRNVEKHWQSSKSEQVQKAFDKLVVWFNKNASRARKLFGIIYENKHRLYNDETIAENIEKAEELDELLEEYNISNINELRTLLTNNKVTDNLVQGQNWTNEAVANLGISSPEEFEAFAQDRSYVDRFDHKSKPTTEMFLFAQKLIARAKKNVIAHIKTLKEYDCKDIEELSTTILGGIKKNCQDISIVVRPSDCGEVLIYYSAETDLLMYEVSELWIDDNKSMPRQLTLGEILKNTGIKRIPLLRR